MSKKIKIKKINSKGFIGAIGDDLPSLIPIVVALLLFFTIFALTLNSYTEKNIELKKNLSLLAISRDLKGDSLLLNVDQFRDRCTMVQNEIHEYNFRVAIYSNEKLKELAELKEQVITDFKSDSFSELGGEFENFLTGLNKGSEQETYSCEYLRKGAKKLTDKKSNYLMRFYPVAVQTDMTIQESDYKLIVPAIMVMVIWE